MFDNQKKTATVDLTMCFFILILRGGILYTDHGAQITLPLPYF